MTDATPARRPGRRLVAAPTEGWKAYALLTLFCCVLFLPGIASLPPLDRDEARFAQATAQMLETRDFVDIRFQDQPRHKKPAGIHWLQAASVTLLSDAAAREIWAYRVPSAVGAWAAVLLTFMLGARLFDRRTAFAGAGMLAASVLVILEAHQAKTDAVLLACVLAQQSALARHYLAAKAGEGPPGTAWALLFWLAIAAGVLVKGPIAPLVTLLTMAALAIADRDGRWIKGLGWPWGLPLALAIALPWFLLVGGTDAGADGFVMTAITTDLIPKLLGGQESHGAPPGYYTVLAVLFFFPGSLLAGPALARAWRARDAAAVRFLLAWLIPAWLLFEAIPTKLPHYVLPLYPALALITARAAVGVMTGEAPWIERRAIISSFAVWGVTALALGSAAAWLPLHFGADPSWRTGLFAVFVLWLVWTVMGAVRRHAMAEVLETATLAGGVLVILVVWLAVARLEPLWVAERAARAVAAEAKDGPRPVVSAAGFSEPSLVFLLGTGTVLTSGGGAAQHLLTGHNRAAIVERRELDAFTRALGPGAATVREAARVSGINYSKGRPVTLHVFVPKGAGE